jgi:hypothetical protein
MTTGRLKLKERSENRYMFPNLDGRTWQGRRLSNVYHQLIEDGGGRSEVSILEDALYKQTASLITIGEDMIVRRAVEEQASHEETKPPDGTPYSYEEHITLIRTLSTLGKTIGLKRKMKEIVPEDLDKYLEEKYEDE